MPAAPPLMSVLSQPTRLEQQSDSSGTGELSARLFAAAAWTCCGWALSRAANVVALVYAARVLGKVSYGHYAIVQAALGVFSLVGAIGLGTTAARYVSHLRKQEPVRAGRVAALLATAAAFCGVFMAVAQWWLPGYLASYPPPLRFLVRLSAPAVLMYSIDGVVTGILSGLECFRSLAMASAVQGMVMVAATALLTPRFGVEGAVAALVLAATVAALTDCTLLYREIRRKKFLFCLAGSFGERGVLFEFSLPATLNSVVLSGTYLLCLSWMGSSSAATGAAGVFGLGRQIGMWVQVVPQIVLRATLPVLSERLSSDRSDASRILATTHGLYMFSCFPLAAIVICSARPLLALALPAFREAWVPLAVLVLASAFGVARGASELLLVADGRAWTNFFVSTSWNAFMLAGALLVAKGQSVTLACLATALGLFLAASVGNRLARVSREWNPAWTDLCMVSLAAVTLISSVVHLSPVSLVVGLVFAVGCYRFFPAGVRSSVRSWTKYSCRLAGAREC